MADIGAEFVLFPREISIGLIQMGPAVARLAGSLEKVNFGSMHHAAHLASADPTIAFYRD